MRLFLTICLFLTCVSFAQDLPNYLSANKISTVAYWNKGDRKIYTITQAKIRYKTDSESVQSETTQTETLEIKVVDSTEHSYTLEARYSNLQSPGLSTTELALAKELKLNYVIRYKTDEFGVFDTITNLPELQREIGKALDQLKAAYSAKASSDNAEEFSLAIDNMRQLYDDREYVESIFIADLFALHEYAGLELVVGQPNEYDLVYPLPTDVVVSGTGTFTLTSVSKSTDLATITGTSRPDKEELNKAMDELFGILTETLTDEKEKLGAGVSSSSKEKIQFRLSDGWVEKVEQTQTTLITIDGKKTKMVVKKIIGLQ